MGFVEGGQGAADERGRHTLKVMRGTVVGAHGRDVFVELGPRMQGVIKSDAFTMKPREGAQFDFTLRGLEEGLWRLALSEEEILHSWEDMEVASIVEGRVTATNLGGLELRVGRLHAFMPRSETGMPRGSDLDELIGQMLVCEVIEVDHERQRCLLSRKRVLKRARERGSEGCVRPGEVVHGRVIRVEDYGAFVRFGRGGQGLVHISNVSHRRIAHPGELLKVGDAVEAKVLHIQRGGKRISLGIKQLGDNPWTDAEERFLERSLACGVVERVLDAGVVIALERDLSGFVPRRECGFGVGEPLTAHYVEGQPVSVRVVSLERREERLTLSFLHTDGARIMAEEAQFADSAASMMREVQPKSLVGTDLGALLKQALARSSDCA
jgi:small subunit ribosomal protein S1